MASSSQARRERRARQAAGVTLPKRPADGFSVAAIRAEVQSEQTAMRAQIASQRDKARSKARLWSEADAARSTMPKDKQQQLDKWRSAL